MHDSVEHLIKIALKEDIGSGDITTDNLVDPNLEGSGVIIAKEPFIVAGLDVACRVFKYLDPEIICNSKCSDGERVENGETVLELQGRLRSLLVGERTALNFIQRLSGIATCVRSYADILENKTIRLVDTRKTAPGWRILEKYAVRIGGAFNHRVGLFDGILIKDNHIAAVGGIKKAVEHVRKRVSHLMKIEIEVEDFPGVKEAVEAGADVIMLDNMDIHQIKKAIRYIDKTAMVEVSGGVTKNDLSLLADTGADVISMGALTYSAGWVDMSMQITQ